MTLAATAATASSSARTAQATASPLAYRLAGLAFATVVPAIFWVVVANWAAQALGYSVPFAAQVAVAAAIAAFLGSVCAPIVLKTGRPVALS